MRRFLLALTALAVIVATSILVFFSASKYHVRDQSFSRSLGDFLFLIGVYHNPGQVSEPWTEARYQAVLSHARGTAHPEVRARVVRELVRAGEPLVPRLVLELDAWADPDRALAAAEALGELEVTSALPSFERALERGRADRGILVRLIDPTSRLGPEAAPVLVRLFEEHRSAGEPPPYNLLDAIGRTGGGTEFLLAEMENARSVEEIRVLSWPLAFTRDERAARVLVGLLHHPRAAVRRRARDSMAQSMGAAAIEPVLDLLEIETDDYVRTGIVERILASPDAASSPRAIAVLGALLDDPVLGDRANYALAQMGTAEAIDALYERTAERDPKWVIDNLEYSGLEALGLLERYLDDGDPGVRGAVVEKIVDVDMPQGLPLLERLTEDPDPYVRREVEAALFRFDLWKLEETGREWLERLSGARLGYLRIRDREGTRNVLKALSLLNWVSLVLSFGLGAAMLLGFLRAFDAYRFTLTLVFVLVAGVLGDYFLSPSPLYYRWATAGRLLLLLGLLFLRDDPLPGEARGRLDRLVVRSLWIAVPLVFVFALPLLSRALRSALSDFAFTKWVLLLLAATAVLAIEQWVVPVELVPRGGRLGRLLSFLLAAALTLLVGVALWRLLPSGSEEEDLFVGLLVVVLAGAQLFHLHQLRLRRPRGRRRKVRPPAGRIRLDDDGEVLSLRLRRRRSLRALPHFIFGGGFLAATWWMSARLGVSAGGGPALLFLVIFGVLGAALVSLLVAGVTREVTLQIAGGAARSAVTFCGGVFGRPAWHRRLRLAALRRGLTLDEREWRFVSELLAEGAREEARA